MVKEQGTVVRMEDGRAIVAVVQTSACQSCKAKQGCGQAVLSEWGEADQQEAKNHFSIPYHGTLAPGDHVTLGIQEDTLALAAVWIYLWPLIGAFAALLVAGNLGWPEPLQLLLALVGGGLAFNVTRRRFRRVEPRWIPEILSVDSQALDFIARQG